MSRIARDVWQRLSGERAQGENLWARRAAPEVCDRVVAAVDADGQHHFLVLLLPGEEPLEDSQSRGLTVATRDLVVPGHDTGRYIDVACNDAAGHDAFDLVGGELAERLAAGNESAPEVIARVINKWRRFWGHAPKQLLSFAAQLGLFAELWFLSLWVLPKAGPEEAVVRWRGPHGARHDFEWRGRSVEVKATTSTRGRVHRINGMDQLAMPDQGDLLFFSLRVREERGATNSLVTLISACRSLLQHSPAAHTQFESSLSLLGYTPAHDDEYDKLRLRIVDEGLYTVRDDFPRLMQEQFRDGTPAGVEHIEYDINLDGFSHLRLAQQSSDLANL